MTSIAVDLAIREAVRVNLVRPDPNSWMARGIFYPEKYGALHGGVDDTEPIQIALDKAGEYGGIVWCYGSYISRQLQIPSNVMLYLASRGTTIKLKDGADEELLVNSDPVSGNTGIEIYGGILDGNKANQGSPFAVIKLTGVEDSDISTFVKDGSYTNLTLLQCARIFVERFRSLNPDKQGILLNDSDDCILRTILHETDSGGVSGYHAIQLYGGSEDNQIIGLTARTTVTCDGVQFHTGCHRNSLSKAVLVGFGNGFGASGANYFKVEDIDCDNGGIAPPNESGIEITGSSYGKISRANLRNNSGAGLYIHTSSDENTIAEVLAELNTWSGFIIAGSMRNKLIGCKSLTNNGRGYFIDTSANYNELLGCDALNNGQGGAYAGVEIKSSDYTKVTAGFFNDNQGVKTQTYGVEEVGTSDHSDIHGIHAAGNLTGAILLLGADSTDTDNRV